MRIIAIARDSYEDYSRHGLLEQAMEDGFDVFYIGFRRGEGKIDLLHNGCAERTLPLNSSPWKLRQFVRSAHRNEETVIYNSAGYNWFWHMLFLRLSMPSTVLVFDVYDWLFYETTGPKLLIMKSIDMVYRKLSDGIIVASHELEPYYPGGFHLDVASYMTKNVVPKPCNNKVTIVASFDNRLDFELLENIIDELAEVEFHFHGWVSDNRTDVQARLAEIAERPNVYYHGPYKNADIENMLKPYGIGLLPYATDNWINRFVNPEKIYHYLQSGMEVISTPIPQAKRMEDCLHIEATPAGFASRIRGLIRGENRKNEDSCDWDFHWSASWRRLRPYLESLFSRP